MPIFTMQENALDGKSLLLSKKTTIDIPAGQMTVC